MTPSDRIEKSWLRYAAKCYPHVPVTSEQYKQLKLCWFSAHFDLLTTFFEEIATLSEDEATLALESMTIEGLDYVRKEVDHFLSLVGTKRPN